MPAYQEGRFWDYTYSSHGAFVRPSVRHQAVHLIFHRLQNINLSWAEGCQCLWQESALAFAFGCSFLFHVCVEWPSSHLELNLYSVHSLIFKLLISPLCFPQTAVPALLFSYYTVWPLLPTGSFCRFPLSPSLSAAAGSAVIQLSFRQVCLSC